MLTWQGDFHNRMAQRAGRVFAEHASTIHNKRVLDLGARHGFWSHAALRLGALETVAVEGRQSNIDAGQRLFDDFPDKNRFVLGDVYDVLNQFAVEGQRFDTVLCLGLYYHVPDHHLLFKRMAALGPKYIIIDSEFSKAKAQVIEIWTEPTAPADATIAAFPGQAHSVVGRISRPGIEMLARAYGYDTQWCDWDMINNAGGCADYQSGLRSTCLHERLS